MKKKYPLDIYFYEAFSEEKAELEKIMPPQIKAGFTWKTIQESGDQILPASIISLRTQSKIPLSWSDKLEGILSRSTGYDHLISYLNQTGTRAKLGYLPLYCNRSVAEHALVMWTSLLRRFPEQMKAFSQFTRDHLTGSELFGKNLLVAGCGNIGSEIVKLGQGIGMQVKGIDPVRKHEFINYSTWQASVSWADVIVAAMNLTPANKGFFNKDQLSAAKQGAVFINVARGELSPLADLLELLEKGHLGGVGLDVFENEQNLGVDLRQNSKKQSDSQKVLNKLQSMPNVILTPHNAFNTKEAVSRKASQSVDQIKTLLSTGAFKWPANKTSTKLDQVKFHQNIPPKYPL